jgi:hypothetical protein
MLLFFIQVSDLFMFPVPIANKVSKSSVIASKVREWGDSDLKIESSISD